MYGNRKVILYYQILRRLVVYQIKAVLVLLAVVADFTLEN